MRLCREIFRLFTDCERSRTKAITTALHQTYPPRKGSGREQLCDCANHLLTFCETNSSLVERMGVSPGYWSGLYLSGVPDGFD